MTISQLDYQLMSRALELAARGLYTTAPNPAVGCVIALGEKIVGEGWHQKAGGPHAEIHALRQAGEAARGATVYVTLEPCAHQGRTGPCAQALIDAGVARVVVAVSDPNPLVAGKGFQLLREAGVVCEEGLCETQARELMHGFLSRMTRQRPFVTLKLAASADGRIALANGESQWITDVLARADVQQRRARNQAIITGSGTVLADNPRLTLRENELALPIGIAFTDITSPLRVVLDSQGQVNASHQVCDGQAPTLLVHAHACTDIVGTESLLLPNEDGHIDLTVLLFTLGQRGINDALVECGPRLAAAFFAAGLVDELVLYQAPCFLGEQGKPLLALESPVSMAAVKHWQTCSVETLGRDWKVVLRPS